MTLYHMRLAGKTAPTALRQTKGRTKLIYSLLIASLVIALVIPFTNLDFFRELDVAEIWTYRLALGRAIWTTILFTLVGSVVAFFGGIVLAVIDRNGPWPARALVIAFVEFWRNTPLLVQLFWVHFALPVFTKIETSVWTSGMIAVSLNATAYACEIVRTGIESVGKNMWEAGAALGLQKLQIWRLIILPMMLRVVLPPATNLLINILKGTSIISILGINELMRVTGSISSHTFRVFEFYTFAAIVYVAMGLMITHASRRLETRLALSMSRNGL